jgi:hypothetical protein
MGLPRERQLIGSACATTHPTPATELIGSKEISKAFGDAWPLAAAGFTP